MSCSKNQTFYKNAIIACIVLNVLAVAINSFQMHQRLSNKDSLIEYQATVDSLKADNLTLKAHLNLLLSYADWSMPISNYIIKEETLIGADKKLYPTWNQYVERLKKKSEGIEKENIVK